ncbi:MAG: hypothetical protein ACOX68_02025 [Candidatus Limivicinus sp.]
MSLKKISSSLFVAIVFAFSAFLAVLSLLISIKLAALNDSALKLEKEAEELREENELLTAQCENSISMEKLESYATEVLGMQHCSPDQIEYIEFKEQGDK